MAFQRVPNTASIVVVYNIPSGVIATNTFYARLPGGYVLADLQALADEVDGWVGSEIRPLLDTGTDYLRTEVTGLNVVNDLQAQSSANAGTGASAATNITNEVTFAIKRVSGFTGRGARGRIFWPSLNANNLATDTNRMATASADAIEDALNVLRTLILVLGWIEVIVSRYLDGQKRAEAVTFDVAGYVYGDLILDSQRGRRPTT